MRADDPADVPRLVAEALDAGGGNALERVTGRLRASRAVLVLDGCEHVVDEAARVTSTMLAECPGVRVIATSREVLHLAGEAQVGSRRSMRPRLQWSSSPSGRTQRGPGST